MKKIYLNLDLTIDYPEDFELIKKIYTELFNNKDYL